MAINPMPPGGGSRDPMDSQFDYPPAEDPSSSTSATAKRGRGRRTPRAWEFLVLLIVAAIIVAVILLA